VGMISKDYKRVFGDKGLIYSNNEVVSRQRSMLTLILKNFGKTIFQGRSVLYLSLPVQIFDERSNLELLAYQNITCLEILKKGALEKDPLEQLKYTVTFMMSRLHLSAAQEKPFNPILGETLQLKTVDTEFYYEQTSHHPPICNFLILNKYFKVYGYDQADPNTGLNSVCCKFTGRFFVEYLTSKTIHEMILPTFKIEGTTLGTRKIYFTGKAQVIDKKNDLISEIHIDPEEKGFISKLFSKKQTYPDYFKGFITKISSNSSYKDNKFVIKNSEKNVISNVEGEYSQFVLIDDKEYWEYNPNLKNPWINPSYLMKSDSSLRHDILLIKKLEYDHCQNAKIKLEERQREDKKLRDNGSKKK